VKEKEKKKKAKDKESTPKEEVNEETGVKTKTKVKKTKEKVTTKKPKETITAVVDKELELLEKEIEKAEVELEKAKAHDAEAQAKEYFKQKYEWISHPWMFSAPSRADHIESWREDWANLLLDWAKYFTKHIVSLMELKDQYPYYNGDIKRSLSEEDLRSIMEFLIARDLAKWVSKEETRLRIYWKSLEAWADTIYEWIIEAWAQDSWVITLIDLVRAKQSFSTIPPKELGEIMKIMIEKGYATKVDEKAIEISF
jgi:hypothetical protein